MRFNVPVLAVVGQATSDGRIFNDAIWRDLPLTLYSEVANTGHDDAPIVGKVESISRDGPILSAIIDVNVRLEEGVKVADLVANGDLRGISIDAAAHGDVQERCLRENSDGLCVEVETTFEQVEIMAATLVGQPAFREAQIDPTPIDAPDDDGAETSDEFSLVASVQGVVDIPIADRDRDWDGSAAAQAVRDLCTEDDTTDWECVWRGFLWRDDDAEPSLSAYKLGIADAVGDEIQAVPAAIFAAAAAVQGARGGVDIPDSDVDAVKATLEGWYARLADFFDDPTIVPPWQDDDEMVASADPGLYADPQLARPTPLTVGEDGRIFGHAALWGTCHIGISGSCVTAPKSKSGYQFFHIGEAGDLCDPVPVGVITAGTSHAKPGQDAQSTLRHYEDTGWQAAYVRCGEDQYGIWVSGVVAPEVMADEARLRQLRASSLSGDWRRIGGHLELVSILAVNTPGFPVARYDRGRPQSMVASGPPPKPDVRGQIRRMLREERMLDRLDREMADVEAALLAEHDATVFEAGERRLADVDRRVADFW